MHYKAGSQEARQQHPHPTFLLPCLPILPSTWQEPRKMARTKKDSGRIQDQQQAEQVAEQVQYQQQAGSRGSMSSKKRCWAHC